MNTSKTWALVLMGGGARGLAHVGVLRVLDKHGLVPDVIASTSMGALVGGLQAAGLLGRDLTEMLDGAGLEKALMLTDAKNRFIKKIGVDKSDAIEASLKSCVGNVRIEDLPDKSLCNAVDPVSGREVLFTRGKLARALRRPCRYRSFSPRFA